MGGFSGVDLDVAVEILRFATVFAAAAAGGGEKG